MKNLRNKNQPVNADLVQVYLQSSWDIVTDVHAQLATIETVATAITNGTLDQYLSAGDIDTLAEVNAIFTDFQVGRFSSQAEAEGGTDNTTTMTPLRVAQAIAALANPFADNLNGLGPPSPTNDETEGYGVNSIWIDKSADPDETYRCTDAATGAAIWIKTSLTADELATVAISGSSDDLVQGSTQLLMTVAERTKLGNIEDGATADQTGAEIKALYEAELDTNAFSDAEKIKLQNIESNATADQTDLEIETAYNNQVAKVSVPEKTAGTETAVRRYSPADIKEMAENFSGGLIPAFQNTNFIAEFGKRYYVDTSSGPITATLPAGVHLGYLGFTDAAHYLGTHNLTILPNGAETVDGAGSFVLDQDESDIELVFDNPNSNWKASVDGTPDVIGLEDLLFEYLGTTTFTGAYELLETDKGNLLLANSGTDVNFTVPSNASVPFNVTSRFEMLNIGAGTITVVVTTDTLASTANKCAPGKAITLLKTGTTTWWVVGGSV